MKIVFHIGADKTGSTAIQQFLAQNIELLSAAGIEYPNILPEDLYPRAHGWAAIGGINVNGNGYPLFVDFSKFESIVNLLISDPSNQDKTFVFSSERLLKTFADEYVWKNLAKISESNNIQINVIAYCRDVISYLESIYNELIRSAGESGEFSQYVSRIPSNPDLAPQILYFPSVIRHSQNFPQVKFSLFRYETHKKEIAEHFLLSATNLTLLDAVPPKSDANRSLSNLESKFLSGINETNPDLGKQLGWRISALPVIDDKRFTLSKADIEQARFLCENYVSEMNSLIREGEHPEIGSVQVSPDDSSRTGEAQIRQLGTIVGNFIKDGR
jgi:hypothetical protein